MERRKVLTTRLLSQGYQKKNKKKKTSSNLRSSMRDNIIDNIFVEFGGRIFQQTIGIPMGTNCAPLHVDLFLYSYEAEFVQSLLKVDKKHRAHQFNSPTDV